MPRTDLTPLTPEQEADLRAVAQDLHGRGVPVGRIAAEMGVTVGTVRALLAAAGPPKPMAARKAEAVRLYAAGCSLSESSTRAGVSVATVRRANPAAGVPPRPPGSPLRHGAHIPEAERRERVAGLYARGLSVRAVARQLGISPQVARADLAAAGVTIRPHCGPNPATLAGARRARAAECYRAGMTAKDVGRELGVTRQAALALLRNAGVTIRPRPRGIYGTRPVNPMDRVRREAAGIARRLRAGERAAALAAEYGVSARSLYRAVREIRPPFRG